MAFGMPGFGDGDDDSTARRPGGGSGGAGGGGTGGGGAGRPGAGAPLHFAFPVPPRRTKVLAITLLVLVVLVIFFLLFTQVYTNFLWFRSVGFSSVYRTRLTTQISLFVIFGVIMAVAVTANVWIAHRIRPPLSGMSLEQQALDRYRMGIAPYLRLLLIAVGILLGIAAGAGAIGGWRTYLLWSNATPFGQTDVQFHKDLGFYVFTLPWLRLLEGFLFSVVVLSLIAAIATHYLYAGIKVQGPGNRVTRATQIHLSVLLGVLVLVKAYAYWLDRYSLTVAGSGITSGWQGATYKDVHAVLPAKNILMVIAILCALLFFINAGRLIAARGVPEVNRGGTPWALPALGVGLMVLSSVVIGGVYPLVVQQFQVNPSQAVKEAPYIQRNIDATRTAYGLDDVAVTPYAATTNVGQGQLRGDANTTAQIRILDPSLVSATFDQTQQVRGFYSFPDDLAVDRYTINGQKQDAVVAVRELNVANAPQPNWVNDHLKYTHGFGFVAAEGNNRDAQGKPVYFEQDIPSTGALGSYQERVYFGQNSPDYSIVGGTAKSTPAEFDYPDDKAAAQQQSSTYQGDGGVPVGSFLNKLLYSVKFGDMKILLTSGINQDSKILYDRDPKQRVQAVAPWLTVDGTAYPAVVDGRIQWIVDGYTTTAAYPYSTSSQLDTVAQDSLTSSASSPLGAGNVNYIRNSVKATVDAYDGTVKLYTWDKTDPILKAWSNAFPGTVLPKEAIPAHLMEHLRYPQDLFKAQRDILSRYHVTNASDFFGGSAFWTVPTDPTKSPTADQPPYYLTLQMPGQTAPTFSLTSTLVPTNRANLAAFVAVDSDPGQDYGKIRVLELPANTTIPGPGQMQNSFRSSPAVAATVNILKSGGSSTVVEGNLLTLPVGGGLLYVEPVYLKATAGAASYPLLQKILVSFGGQIAFEDTLQKALDDLFGGNSGATTGETTGGGTPPTSGGTATPGGGGGTQSQNPQLAAALAAVKQAQTDAVAALAKVPTDWDGYAKAQKSLDQAIQTALAIENALPGGAPSTNPSAPATPSAPASGATSGPASAPSSGNTPTTSAPPTTTVPTP